MLNFSTFSFSTFSFATFSFSTFSFSTFSFSTMASIGRGGILVALIVLFHFAVPAPVRAITPEKNNPSGKILEKPRPKPAEYTFVKQSAFDRPGSGFEGSSLSNGFPAPAMMIKRPQHSGDERFSTNFPVEWASALFWGAVAVLLSAALLGLSGLSIPEAVHPGLSASR